MKKIQPGTERKLIECVGKTTDYVSDGMSPNDAIIKAASEVGVRPGEVSLVVHAYNTGRTTQQRVDGADPFEKSAEFEIADLTTILDKMYPDMVKTAAAQYEDTVISTDYAYSPRPMLERRQSRVKAAAAIDWRGGLLEDDQAITAPVPYPTDPRAGLRKASAELDRVKRATEELRRDARNAFDQMGKTFTDLTTYFRRPDARPMPVVKEAVIMLHGDKGEQIMDQLVKVTPGLTKFANHTTLVSTTGVTVPAKLMSLDDMDCDGEPFDKIAQLVEEIDAYKEKKAAYFEAEANFTKQAEVLLGPFVQPAVSQSVLGPSSTEKQGGLPMILGYDALKRTMGGVAEGIKAPEEDKLVQKTLTDLTDPAHEAKLQGINSQAMMQDLLLNDPVISGYDPEEVVGAFNDVTQISPGAADQRLLMQSLLRKKLEQGQLDQFDVDQMLGMETKLRQQKAPNQQVKGVAADGSVI